ncbi:MAG: hydrogenase maturation protease [Planctomycetota bacterium]
MPGPPSILVIGYGNPARGDDGLGPAAADAVAAAGLAGVTVRRADQLQIEDAEELARHDATVFVDAHVDGAAPFELAPLRPDAGAGLGTHAVHPAALLSVARDVLGAGGAAYVLAIRGYEFDMFCERLSPHAARNLAEASTLLVGLLGEPDAARALELATTAGPTRAGRS